MAQPIVVLAKATLRMTFVVPLAWAVQFDPPSDVWSIAPPTPTAHPVSASTNATPVRAAVVPLTWVIQLVPPSVVCRISPLLPTTHPVVGLTNETPLTCVATIWVFQVVPPVAVWRMLLSPTTHPFSASTKAIAGVKALQPPLGCKDQVVPPSVV